VLCSRSRRAARTTHARGTVAERLAAVEGRFGGVELAGKLVSDFRDTAASAEQPELVIAVDTSVAHLAAAPGRPVWVLLPYYAN
jgi:ADP-heptose:LPS heptosyltransferase